MPMWDLSLIDVHLATMTEGRGPYSAISDGALAVKDGRIAWLGAAADLPQRAAGTVIDGRGGCLTPGLIDCHTHLVFAGDPAGEFERLMGVSYEEIARAAASPARSPRPARPALRSSKRARASGLMRSGPTA